MSRTEEAGYTVETIDALACGYSQVPWSFAEENRDAIERHWAACVRERPKLFNGRVLIQTQSTIERTGARAVFQATYTAVDFAAFLAWRDWGRPGRGVRNGFGMAALQAADGAFVLGEMAPHTANAGRVYFPSGTPDMGDVVDGRVDVVGSIRRELGEETGLDTGALTFEPTITAIHDVHRVCFMQRVRAPEPASELVATIEAALAREPEPELCALHVVRSAADLTAAMPPFVTLYLARAFAERQPG